MERRLEESSMSGEQEASARAGPVHHGLTDTEKTLVCASMLAEDESEAPSAADRESKNSQAGGEEG
jgi:hypothetical protein